MPGGGGRKKWNESKRKMTKSPQKNIKKNVRARIGRGKQGAAARLEIGKKRAKKKQERVKRKPRRGRTLPRKLQGGQGNRCVVKTQKSLVNRWSEEGGVSGKGKTG